MVVKLSQADIQDLKRQGFSEKEISNAVKELEREEMLGVSSDTPRPSSQGYSSAFATGRSDDLARIQLELNDLLEQTEHILKGDVVRIEDNKKRWDRNPFPEKNPLNDEGVRRIMTELQNYVNKHVILGDYDSEDINTIMKDYGKKLADLIFMKYEDLGMDTDEKRQEYVSLVMNIVNLVYASYSRAKDGAERRSYREMFTVAQSYNAQGGMPQQMMMGQGKTRGVLNPMRYIAGKYV